jgi:hypothetical protein
MGRRLHATVDGVSEAHLKAHLHITFVRETLSRYTHARIRKYTHTAVAFLFLLSPPLSSSSTTGKDRPSVGASKGIRYKTQIADWAVEQWVSLTHMERVVAPLTPSASPCRFFWFSLASSWYVVRSDETTHAQQEVRRMALVPFRYVVEE